MATTDSRTSVGGDSDVGAVYDGFISYSHAADDLLAPRLQAGLQRFAKPWWKRRALRIFRDESSLSANPHLWSSIIRHRKLDGAGVAAASVTRKLRHIAKQLKTKAETRTMDQLPRRHLPGSSPCRQRCARRFRWRVSYLHRPRHPHRVRGPPRRVERVRSRRCRHRPTGRPGTRRRRVALVGHRPRNR